MRFLLALALLVSSVLPASALAYSFKTTSEGTPLYWPTMPIHFVVDPSGSEDVKDGSSVHAVRKSFDTWSNVPGGDVRLAYDGPMPGVQPGYDPDTPDLNVNGIMWIETGWPFDPNALAVTLTFYKTRSGELVDADIAFNGDRFRWTTTDEPGHHDVENSGTHEVGHLLGLAHAADVPAATMYPDTTVGETEKRSLDEDDMEGIRFLYPGDPSWEPDPEPPVEDAPTPQAPDDPPAEEPVPGGSPVELPTPTPPAGSADPFDVLDGAPNPPQPSDPADPWIDAPEGAGAEVATGKPEPVVIGLGCQASPTSTTGVASLFVPFLWAAVRRRRR